MPPAFERHEVYQDAEDPNGVVVIAHVPSIEQAKAYFGSESVQAAVARSGIQGPPAIWFLESVELKEY